MLIVNRVGATTSSIHNNECNDDELDECDFLGSADCTTSTSLIITTVHISEQIFFGFKRTGSGHV